MIKRGLNPVLRLSGVLSLLAIAGCGPNYFLLHPLKATPEVYRENIFFDRGQLRVYWLTRYPDTEKRLPAVLVHPDRGSFSHDMEGICLDLAQRGYFAVSVHYQRLEDLGNENPLIPWRSAADILSAYEHLRRHPRVDPDRIGLLGFSRGGIVSLQIAAEAPSIKAAVAYYALADFEEWLDVKRYSFPKSLLFKWVRARVIKETGEPTEEKAQIRLRETSPINFYRKIEAPVLLIHGEKDRTFPVEQMEKLCRLMQEAGKNCELLVVPKAGHVFNFTDEEKGRTAWEKTIHFLDRHVAGKPLP
jgi:dienelactone hydrolase